MGGWLSSGQVLSLAVAELVDFDFIEVQIPLSRQLEPHEAGLMAGQGDAQRFAIRGAEEDLAVLLVDLVPLLAVLRQEHPEPGRPGRGRAVVTTVIDEEMME